MIVMWVESKRSTHLHGIRVFEALEHFLNDIQVAITKLRVGRHLGGISV